MLLVLGAAFVLVATPVAVQITPPPQQQSLVGFPPPLRVWDRHLVWPGSYRLQASLQGHHPLDETLEVSGDGLREFRFALRELPGRVFIQTEPAVPFRLMVDDTDTPLWTPGGWRRSPGAAPR